ncbi:LytTR family DNA-binding domain-containing protein [Carboxylicivirga sp. M1479]|uniref:LytR/AlgR family response regulator transcription factor n=1 Tax=Carboxylicivirga sp. M1479 TaxID=2594476 RepID=UPI0011775AD1|nr:LytTR family DNA-binding domain-containing protein [Carboxylicivirga sp. M1479]TRX72137.1 LytTR family transcriptional regulator [Carboxylicivirga sp. M1479]
MDFSKALPSYQVKKKNIVRLILFTATFALVFINIYQPFDVSNWFEISKLELFLYSSLVILTGVLVVVISRIIMYHRAKRGKHISIGRYLLSIAIEIICMSLFYTLYELIILHDPRTFEEAFKVSILNTALVLLIPYTVSWLFFAWMDNKEKLEALEEGDIDTIKPEVNGMVMFNDDKGTMRLSIKQDDLLYLQGADNYVTIYYSHQQKQEKFLLRNTLKKLEDTLKPLNIIRCHRSYMVNFRKVKMIERTKDGLRIKLNTQPLVEIPVSKTYTESIFQLFGQSY